MNIRGLVRSGAAVIMILLCAGGMLAASRINAVRIGGPIQTEMQEASDLVADILPPPEYVLEPFLEATLLLARPGEYEARAARLQQLKKDYDDRHAYWLASSIDPSLRSAITEGSHEPAEMFWRELDTGFLPAVRARDQAAMDASYGRLSAAYDRHRAMIDRIVALAATYQTDLKARAAGQLSWAMSLLIGLAIAIFAVVGAACFMLLQRVVQPLIEVVDATSTLANGGHAVVPHQQRRDELGSMAIAVELFRKTGEARTAVDARNAAEQQLVTTSLAASLHALRSGDLTSPVREDFPVAYAELKTNFNGALDALREMIQRVSESAREISTGSSEIAAASEDLARRTASNAASLEQTSAALAQVENRITSTSDASLQTVARADHAAGTVEKGRLSASSAVEAMNRVSGSARGIDAVIDGLDKIAFQTRVLAMNAAIEAGRAGDAGRGFAVVADLVSALALRAELEAKQAHDQITLTQREITVAALAVEGVDGALAEIAGDVDQVHELLKSMSADNQAQALTISEIAAAIGVMDHSTQQNAAMVEETSAATRSLSGEVAALAERAAAFRYESDHRIAASASRAAPILRRSKLPLARPRPAGGAVQLSA